MANGGKTAWEHTVEKYGIIRAKEIYADNKIGNTSGSGNKGKVLSIETKLKIAANHKGGRKKISTDNADVL